MRALGLLLLVVLAGCGGTPSAGHFPGTAPSAPAMQTRSTPKPPVMHPPHRTAKPSASPRASPRATPEFDRRWRFYVSDRHRYASPWFAGRHRLMIGFGCTRAPYYDHDPRCPGREGFHHGVDVAMACGTRLFSGVDGTVLPADAPGAPGPAYGVHPFRIRAGTVDVLLGHARQVYVSPGQHVHRGQPIALSSDSGAPDGCHLHFEVRRHGTGLSGAIAPARWLRLRY